jgi:hypothetical protein
VITQLKRFSKNVLLPLVLGSILATTVAGAAHAAPANLESDQVSINSATGAVTLVGDALSTTEVGSGYATGASINSHTYNVFLVNSPRAEQYRSSLNAVAAELNGTGMASLNIVQGTVPEGNPKAGEIYFRTGDTSPCGSTVAGCGGSIDWPRSRAGTTIARMGLIWILPGVDGYSAENKRHVVGHEMGHALGLMHFAEHYQGKMQIMHPSSYDTSTFRAGDLRGLSRLSQNMAPVGKLWSVTPRPSQVVVEAWAFDADLNAGPKMVISIDGRDVLTAEANTANAALQRNFHASFDRFVLKTVVAAAPGSRTVCVRAVNSPVGADVPIGCKTVNVKAAAAAPVGELWSVTPRPSQVVVEAWAFDADLNAGPKMVISIDGRDVLTAEANIANAALQRNFRASFDRFVLKTVVAADPGSRTVCVRAVNSPVGSDVPIGCKTVTVKASTAAASR